MKWSLIAAALALTMAPMAAESQRDSDWKGKHITLRGCVEQGAKAGHYVMTDVTEVVPSGASTMPAYAHGRRVIFWLEDLPNLKAHMGHTIDVRGKYKSIKESETDPKVQDGAFVVELEGPGRDVDLTAAQAAAVGTAGTTMKTFLVRVDVDNVKMFHETCQ